MKLYFLRHNKAQGGTWQELNAHCTALTKTFVSSLKPESGPKRLRAIGRVVPQESHPYTAHRKDMVKDPKLFIIGTFPPASYLLTQLNVDSIAMGAETVKSRPLIDFYHGNDGMLWRCLSIPDATPKKCLDLLREHGAVYADIIASCTRERITDTADARLQDILLNQPLMNEVLDRADKPHLWFTSSGVFNSTGLQVHVNHTSSGMPGNVVIKLRDPYSLFLRGLQDDGHHLAVRRDGKSEWIAVEADNRTALSGLQHLTCHQLRVHIGPDHRVQRVYTVYTGPSPSGAAALQMGKNPNYRTWSSKNPDAKTPTVEFRSYLYAQFLQRTWR